MRHGTVIGFGGAIGRAPFSCTIRSSAQFWSAEIVVITCKRFIHAGVSIIDLCTAGGLGVEPRPSGWGTCSGVTEG